MRILILGLDGATWDVFTDDVLDAHMPHLKKLKSEGASGLLESTIPAMTPAAWTTCISGCQPGTHGLANFQQYAYKDDTFYYPNSTQIRTPNMFHYFSDAGYKVACINVPMTYPVFRVNGYMISGLGCPETTCKFVHPPEFKNKLLEHIPDYGIALGVKEGLSKRSGGMGNSQEQFEKKLRRVLRRFEQRLEAARFIRSQENIDIMMVQFQQLDTLQHLCWPYIDAATRDQYPWFRDKLFELYKKLDDLIGELVSYVDSDQGLTVVVSDHGFGPNPFALNINKLLCDCGYICRSGTFSRMVRRLRRNAMRLNKNMPKNMGIGLRQPVNWGKTKAMVLLRQTHGVLFLNVKGRQPYGCVEPGAEFDGIIHDLKSRLMDLKNPFTGETVFDRIDTPKSIYQNDRADAEVFGDLVLLQKPHYRMCTSMKASRDVIEQYPKEKLNASWHYPNGIVILHGQGIKAASNVNAHIADIAPTLYTWLGMSIPAEVDGQPIKEALMVQDVPQNQNRSYPSYFSDQRDDVETSQEEQAALVEQLENLGYL
jgi:predicted AlkP superfamily phosphohydrolase/phosphomutase